MESRPANFWLWVLLALVLVVGVVAVIAALVAPYGGYAPYGYGMMGGWGWGIGMMLVPLVVLVVIVLILVGGSIPRGAPVGYVAPVPPYGATASALDFLNARYARGEISREEYLRVRADLEGRAPPGGST